MLAKFEQNRMTQTTQKFGALRQNAVYYINHFWHIVSAILKEVSANETIKNA